MSISVFHALEAADLMRIVFHARINHVGLDGYRHRWSKTSFTLPGMKSRIHASRTQLITIYGEEVYAVLWQEVLDLEQKIFEAIRALEKIQASDLVDRLMSVVHHTPEAREGEWKGKLSSYFK